MGERVEGDLGGGVLGLAESGAVLRALEDLAVKVDGGLEPGRVVGTFPNARVGWEVEAAPLGQLLKLVFVHFFFYCSSLLYFPLTPKLSLSLSQASITTTTTLSSLCFAQGKKMEADPDRIRGFSGSMMRRKRFGVWF